MEFVYKIIKLLLIILLAVIGVVTTFVIFLIVQIYKKREGIYEILKRNGAEVII